MTDPQDNYTAYFDLFWSDASVAGKEIGDVTAGERERVEVIAAAIPDDAGTILDVGCGGGLITNYLFDHGATITGMDISHEALAHVRAPSLLASTENIPAADQSFDLLLVADVLEHLPHEQFERTLAELARVSDRYLVLNSPHAEVLELARTRCTRCTTAFHSSRHVRSIAISDLEAWFPDFDMVAVHYAGEPRLHRSRRFQLLAQTVGDVWYRPERAVCPNCGYHVVPPRPQPLVRALNGAVQRLAAKLGPARPSEFVALMRRRS